MVDCVKGHEIDKTINGNIQEIKFKNLIVVHVTSKSSASFYLVEGTEVFRARGHLSFTLVHF